MYHWQQFLHFTAQKCLLVIKIKKGQQLLTIGAPAFVGTGRMWEEHGKAYRLANQDLFPFLISHAPSYSKACQEVVIAVPLIYAS
ncbi:hypothetical protein NHX12_011249 [Muraenolepis orangiensis]|uniref:Uncharacterized protein n=1 Tax=Muraenolepis orangiensis TaxID=630683 RepID=A0A9Q0I5H9_9TELE|nr:hypothetical protein NHX12_011249 [Muraenolepis orangiensis]